MYELLKLFFEICFFKKGPQDVPGSGWLLRLLIIVYAGASYLLIFLSADMITSILQVCVEIFLILSLTWLVLFFTNKRARFQQTVSALMGTDALISVVALPAMATLVSQGTGLAFLAILLLMIWHWSVTGHIFKHALDQPFAFGLGVALMYILTSYQVMAFLFPEVIINEGGSI